MTTNADCVYEILLETHGNTLSQLVYFANGIKKRK